MSFCCPKCGSENIGIYDSRRPSDISYLRRRRKCNECGFYFGTKEMYLIRNVFAVLKNGIPYVYNKTQVLSRIVNLINENNKVSLYNLNELINKIDEKVCHPNYNEDSIISYYDSRNDIQFKIFIISDEDIDELITIAYLNSSWDVYMSYSENKSFIKNSENTDLESFSINALNSNELTEEQILKIITDFSSTDEIINSWKQKNPLSTW